MDIKIISDRIKWLCKERNWSYYRLAKEAGFQQSSITAIVKGENMPTLYTISKICMALDITLSEFFYDKEKEAFPNEPFYHLWEQLSHPDKQKVLIYMHGLLHKTIEGETLNDV